jgi:protein-S-isoprenylcysteine O-methyltransferase Ste14
MDPIIAAGASLTTYALCRHRDLSDTDLSIAIVLSVSASLSVFEFTRVNRERSRPRQDLLQLVARSLRQWLEAMIALALVIFCWWLLDAEYGQPEYKPLWEALYRTLPFAIPIVLVCVVLTEWRLGPVGETSTPIVDCLLSDRPPNCALLRDALLALAVRMVFLPLNFCALEQCIEHFRGREAYLLSATWPDLHAEVLILIYALLIAAIVPGYLFSSRLLATHTRKVDTTLLGWVATLACYRPLSTAVFGRWLNYHGQLQQTALRKPWAELTSGWPYVSGSVGLIIILLELVHFWGEASFGLRASNLSNRGIISNGPYRYCKHPIYLSKCLGWLLLYMPFIADSVFDSVRSSLLFSMICLLYATRAWAEERLLAHDPEYVTYALWIDSHGMFSWIARIFPAMSFRSRLARWQTRSES